MHGRRRWYCSKKASGCKAVVLMLENHIVQIGAHPHLPPKLLRRPDEVEYMSCRGGQGNKLAYKGYTYFAIHNRRRWYCSKKSKGCKAVVLLLENKVTEIGAHDHLPPQLFRHTIEYIPSKRGKYIAVFKGYTFNCAYSNNRWYCSKRLNGCKSKLWTTPEGLISFVQGEHNHPPPDLHRTDDESPSDDADFLRYYRHYKKHYPEKFPTEIEESESFDPVGRVSDLLNFLVPKKK
ncbi:unnamed protein product [Colias eurytheme]|nr:unnamed protein product [Colias eurytheme]